MARVEDYILAAENPEGKKQRRPFFRRKRSNEVLTREQVKAIKKGRKLLRKDLKKQGVKDKQDFEVIAASQGLYFDKWSFLAFWWMKGCGLWALLGSILALLGVMMLLSWVTELRGHFTISLAEDLFREGFVLSETADFKQPTTYLFATPAEDVPCISINDIPLDVDSAYEGAHNAQYFAYTFFLRNEGHSTVDYTWSMELNSESKSLSDGVWVMIFEDGKMRFYAEPNDQGKTEALPAFEDNTRGYVNPKIMELCAQPEEQFELIRQRGELSYYRLIPETFLSLTHVAEGGRELVKPMDVHKYTIVIWLEGDDPDCDNSMIGGHVGMEFNIELTNVHGGEA